MPLVSAAGRLRVRSAFHSELGVVLLMFLLVNGASLTSQRPTSYAHGQGFDGGSYFTMATQFDRRTPLSEKAPFVYRVGTPLLVSLLFTGNLIAGFAVVNIAANAVTTVLLLVWLRHYIATRRVRLLLVALFLITWLGPVRFVHFNPVYVDPWFFAAVLAGLIGIRKVQDRPTRLRVGVLGLIVFAGTVFRESMLLVPVALLFAGNPLPRPRAHGTPPASPRIPIAYSVLPLGLGLLGLSLTFALASPTKEYSFVGTAVDWALEKSPMRYAHAWWIAFGPVLVCAIYSWRRSISFLLAHQFMLVYLGACVVLGWIGGTDTERLLYWSMPVVFVLVGRAIEAHSAILRSLPLRLALITGQLVSQRVLWTIPDYPNDFRSPFPVLTVPTSACQYFDLWAHFSSPAISAQSFAEYTAFATLLLAGMAYRDYAQRGAVVSGPAH